MKTQLSAIFAMVVLLFTACSTPPPPPAPETINMEELKVQIQGMEDAYAAAEKAKDAAAVVAYYSDDAVSYGRNKEPEVGKEAIKNAIADRMAKDTTGETSVYKVVDLYADGKMALEIGSWTSLNPAGEAISHGHYMSYFEKRDGKYVCVRDMNVSSMPVKP